MPIDNVRADYPPTLLIHGDRDTDVPFERSVLMSAELARHGVEHRHIPIAGAEHGFDGGERADVEAAYEEATSFLRRHLLETTTEGGFT
jgi:dipeptidyl aminopeptidase/acylaminoacyl peptidase